MKPPMCNLCKRKFSPSKEEGGGGTVRFADYKPLPRGMVGHPYGLAWFCGEHIKAAKVVKKLDYKDAMQQLRQGLD